MSIELFRNEHHACFWDPTSRILFKILRMWVRMARELPVEMIVPQHGAPIRGSQAIRQSFDWIETLMCGVDLFDDRAYQLPTVTIDPDAKRVRPPLRAVA